MTEMIMEQHDNVRLTELWDDIEGLPAYAVHNGRSVSIFTGEMAWMDAKRKYYDTVLPMIYGGKK